jgi:hypothetical protein
MAGEIKEALSDCCDILSAVGVALAGPGRVMQANICVMNADFITAS